MEDFNWIKKVSSDKIIVLEFLMGLRVPSNFNNAFHKRRDLLNDYLVKINNLKISTKNGTVENYVIVTLQKKITYTLRLAEHYGPSGCKDNGYYGQGKHVKNALKGIKKTVKEGIENINCGDDSLWWLEDEPKDNGRFYYRSNYVTNYREDDEKWWKNFTGEKRKNF